MPTLRTLIAALAAATLATTASAGAATKPRPTCKRSNSTTIAQNSLVRIFTRPDPDAGYAEETDLLGCWKKTGRVRLLAYAFDDEYVSSSRFALVRIHGRFAAYYSESDDVSCKTICPPGWEATRRHLNVADISTGAERSVKVDGHPASNRLLLDARGAIAWPRRIAGDAVEVRVLDAAGGRALDTGAIAPRSLTLSARGRLRWVNGTTPRMALLAPFT